MPSSNKTLHLQLNRWLGEDKPKREDFNEDNGKVDGAVGALEEKNRVLESARERMEQRQEELAGKQTALDGKLQGVEGAAAGLKTGIEGLEQAQSTLRNGLESHEKSAAHVSDLERILWNSGIYRIGRYTGDGDAERQIVLGYAVYNGFLFAADTPPSRFVGGELQAFSAYLSSEGCSKGVTLTANGFRVANAMLPGADGVAVKLNESGVRYIYIVRSQPV